MKKLAIIYRNSDNHDVIRYLQKTLEEIFGNTIFINNFYLNELPLNFIIDADAYLITSNTMLYPLKTHLPNYSNVVIMNRSINKKHLSAILSLPETSKVLLVNDSYENAVQTIYTFYELGFNLNFIPFDPKEPFDKKYQDIDIAITPNEPQLVPTHIKNILNIGYREVSFDSVLRLMGLLDLSSEEINRNLIRHMHLIIEANIDFHNNYLSNFLKSQVLNNIIDDTAVSLLICNENYDLVYSNKKANILFNIKDNAVVSLSAILGISLFESIKAIEFSDSSIDISGEPHFVGKNEVMLMDETIGYYFTFKNEKDLRDIEINLKNTLGKKGQYAKYNFKDIIHTSSVMSTCIELSKKAAITDNTILITGESGTGKELLAQSIHNYSYRKNKPFVAVNCAAIPESLLESELFGYENGAFTGARKNGKLGFFEQAINGTIFLDEIGDITPRLQSRLLRVLQEKQIMRIGSDKIINVDTRIIAASNKDLYNEVAYGNFRSDLFYRLNIITINILPLRKRKEDILPLFLYFLGEKYSTITEAERKFFVSYDWPGNVRELENATIYYKTLSVFPEFRTTQIYPNSKIQETNCAFKDDYLKVQILGEILKSTQKYHGIGKKLLNSKLKEKNIIIGDVNLGKLLESLKNENLISINKGRSGAQITSEGITYISQNKKDE